MKEPNKRSFFYDKADICADLKNRLKATRPNTQQQQHPWEIFIEPVDFSGSAIVRNARYLGTPDIF